MLSKIFIENQNGRKIDVTVLMVQFVSLDTLSVDLSPVLSGYYRTNGSCIKRINLIIGLIRSSRATGGIAQKYL